MNSLVLLKMVPDIVEELDIADDGKSLDTEFLRFIASERDDHALEESLVLKERLGGTVTVLAIDAPEVDEALYTALAKGVDRVVKVVGVPEHATTLVSARILAEVVSSMPGLPRADLVLTGVQAIDDLDGQLAPLLSHLLGLPYLGIVTAIEVDPAEESAIVVKEYAGGVRGEFEVKLPAVLGIQAAERPPRYVTVARVRAAARSGTIETLQAPEVDPETPVEIPSMEKPEVAERATILEGSPVEVAEKLCAILDERGLFERGD